MEDPSSSFGGRCAVVSADDAAVMQPPHEEGCRKCQGYDSCDDSDQSKIGCGSCNADMACRYLAAGATIGTNSCNNNYSCFDVHGELNLNKCNDVG